MSVLLDYDTLKEMSDEAKIDMLTGSLNDMMRILASITASYEETIEKIKALKAEFEASEQYVELVEARNTSNNLTVELREQVSRIALAIYQINPSIKKPNDYLTVQQKREVKYDPQAALEWAVDSRMKHLISPATLKTAEFEKFVRNNPSVEIPGVEVVIVPVVAISTKLQGLLENGEGKGQGSEDNPTVS